MKGYCYKVKEKKRDLDLQIEPAPLYFLHLKLLILSKINDSFIVVKLNHQ